MRKPSLASLHHLGDAQTARVRRDHAVVVDDLLQLGEERPLRLHLLDDGLDDEIAVFDAAEVVLDVADGHQARVVLDEERGRSGLERLLESRGREAVARGSVCAALEVGRHDIHEKDRHPGVRQVSGDAAAHDACPDDRGPTDRFGHLTRIRSRTFHVWCWLLVRSAA